mmetsp:Transcript_18678/g.70669  ORF Transcript_18678/g.70669 Transcript_18678/m.70669 type:complete len:251 (-) Transcript_18678:482-1234(-)
MIPAAMAIHQKKLTGASSAESRRSLLSQDAPTATPILSRSTRSCWNADVLSGHRSSAYPGITSVRISSIRAFPSEVQRAFEMWVKQKSRTFMSPSMKRSPPTMGPTKRERRSTSARSLVFTAGRSYSLVAALMKLSRSSESSTRNSSRHCASSSSLAPRFSTKLPACGPWPERQRSRMAIVSGQGSAAFCARKPSTQSSLVVSTSESRNTAKRTSCGRYSSSCVLSIRNRVRRRFTLLMLSRRESCGGST